MPADKPTTGGASQRCPICWTWFTPNSPNSRYPRRYCCGACRIEDSRRRRREHEQTQQLTDPNSAAGHAEAGHYQTTQQLRQLNERKNP